MAKTKNAKKIVRIKNESEFKYSLPAKSYQFSNEVHRINEECRKIQGYWEQVTLLKGYTELINKKCSTFIENCYNNLSNDFHKQIEKWYNKRFNSKVQSIHNENIELSEKKFIQLKRFFNLFKNFIWDTRGTNLRIREIESKYFQKPTIFIKVNINEYNQLEEYYCIYKKFQDDLEKIRKLIEIKLKYYAYKNCKEKYDFSDCSFENQNEEDNVSEILEFSSYLESISEKLIYLKYVLNYFIDRDNAFEITIEIEKLENILKYDNTGQANIIKEVEQQNKNKDVKILHIEKITWLKNKQDLVDLFDTLESLGYIAFKKNKDEILRNHFTWPNSEIGKNDLKSHRNNLKNKSETYNQSDEIKTIKEKL